MTIGIIGAGNIGQAVAKRLASAGISASIANNRGPSSLSSIVQNLGAGITAVELKVAAKADVVFLAVPWSAYADAVADLAPWGRRIVIDAMNAASVGPEGYRPFDLGGRPSSQVVADRLTGARVVKAFNTLPAAVLASDPKARGRAAHRSDGVRGHRPRRLRDGPATPRVPWWSFRGDQRGSVPMRA